MRRNRIFEGPHLVYAVVFIMATRALSQITLVNVGYSSNGDGGYAHGIAVSGTNAYVANGSDGLRIFEVSDPANPVNVGHCPNFYPYDSLQALSVAVSSNFAYVAEDAEDELVAADISNTANPTNVWQWEGYGYCQCVAIQDRYLFTADSTNGMGIFDISSGSQPNVIGRVYNGGYAYGVAVSGHYAFLANGTDGVRVYNISNPSLPINVAHTNDGGFANGIAVSGIYAYLANDYDGLRVYDISIPSNPVNIAHINNGGFADGVAVSGNYAYLANDINGLRVYDISVPSNPINVAYASNTNIAGGIASGVAVSGAYVYVANGSDGLRIFLQGVIVAPLLSINSAVAISWPASYSGWVLQETSALGSTNWVSVSNAPVVVGGENQVTILQSSGSQFFRLSQP